MFTSTIGTYPAMPLALASVVVSVKSEVVDNTAEAVVSVVVMLIVSLLLYAAAEPAALERESILSLRDLLPPVPLQVNHQVTVIPPSTEKQSSHF